MTLQQLEYVAAVARHQHFAKAAEACFVTQPTLSMMIRKLEQELGVQIFDRNRKPVQLTPAGKIILERARKILKEAEGLSEWVRSYKGEIEGTISVGIIPTLAPYILPLFGSQFLKKYPRIKLKIWEYTTEQIVHHLKAGTLDMGLLATPLEYPGIKEYPLFYEPFVVYTKNTYSKEYLLPNDIDPSQLWLMEEAHCFQSQVLKLCELREQSGQRLDYEAGSIETLIQLVNSQEGITILPKLATYSLPDIYKERLKFFHPPVPAREISLVVYDGYARDQVLNALTSVIKENLPKSLQQPGEIYRIGVEVEISEVK